MKYGDTDLNIIVPNGQELSLVVRADTQNVSAVNGVKITASIDVANDMKIVETMDDTQVTDVVPSAVSFKALNGVAAAVSINNVSMSSTKNAVIGSKGVEGLTFEVKSTNDASALKVTELKVKGIVTDNASTSTITVA